MVDSNRNTISEWVVGFRYRPWEANFSSLWLIFGGEEISIPETRPIWKSYIYDYTIAPSFSFVNF